jgi:hypothetical protein
MNALGRSLWVFPGALGFVALLACSYPPHHHQPPAPISSQHKDGHDYVRPSKSSTSATVSKTPCPPSASSSQPSRTRSHSATPSTSQSSSTGVTTTASTVSASTPAPSGSSKLTSGRGGAAAQPQAAPPGLAETGTPGWVPTALKWSAVSLLIGAPLSLARRTRRGEHE